MRIVSKFHDYYDSVQAHGSDPALVYNRVTKEHSPPWHLWKHDRVRKIGLAVPHEFEEYLVEGWLVAFCGRLYPVWRCEGKWCLTAEDVRAYVKPIWDAMPEARSKKEFRFDDDYHPRFEIEDARRYHGVSRSSIKGCVDQFDGTEISPDIHREFGAPVLLLNFYDFWRERKITVTANPCLTDLQFFTKVDAFTAYQEIAMYLGNELAQPDIAPQSVGSDEDLAKAKGFDDQSFRTASPGQKKQNRKTNKAKKRGHGA